MANETSRERLEKRIDCRSFAERIMELDPGDSKAFQHRELRDHLLTCPDCQNLMHAFWSTRSDAVHPRLTSSILEQTSGGSCRQATELLCDLIDGTLAENQAQLVELHLAHCPDCTRLAEVLDEMKRSLPTLAELRAPIGFANQVLGSLPFSRQSRPGWIGRLQAWFAALPERPLISVEAAYLGALLMFLLFGNPFAALPESRRLLAGFAEQVGAVQLAQTGYEGVERYVQNSFEAVNVATTRLQASGQDLEELRADLSGKIDTYYGRGQSTVKSVAHFFEQKGSNIKKKLQSPER